VFRVRGCLSMGDPGNRGILPRLFQLIEKPSGEEPGHTEHIERGGDGAFEPPAVFASAGVAATVVDGDFRNAVAGPFDEGGDEAVHAGKGDEGVAALPPHGLEGAAGVPDPIAGEAGAHGVGDPALEAFERGVFPVGAVTADEFGAVFYLGEELGYIGRIILEIPVEEGDDLAGCRVDPRVHRSTLTGVFFELEDADERALGDTPDGGIRGAVVHEDEFEVEVFEGTFYLFDHGLDVFLFVVEGDDDGECGSFSRVGFGIHSEAL